MESGGLEEVCEWKRIEANIKWQLFYNKSVFIE